MKKYLRELPTNCNYLVIWYKSWVKTLEVSRSEKLDWLILSGLEIEVAIIFHPIYEEIRGVLEFGSTVRVTRQERG